MKNFKILVYALILNWVTLYVYCAQQFGPQPRIISSDGHLIFNSAENKDIHFITKGLGKIMLNNGDLTSAADLAKNASDLLHQINADYYSTHFEVQKFKRLLYGPTGMLNRLSVLERGGGVNSTIGNSTSIRLDELSMSVINRRLRNLQRKVNRLLVLLNRDECSSNPCENGATCQDLFDGYFCHCPKEWEGPVCDRDVNECARFAGTDLGCQNGATCVNKIGSYECVCPTGWFGLHCTRQTASCTSGSVAELCGHGTCIAQNNGVGYKCLCDQGWTTEGTSPACVKDVDECSMNKPPCSVNPPVNCVNVPGTFYCANCPAGYTGNGYYCTDLDECAVFNGGCSVNPMVHCINTPGSKMCGSCPPGYMGDGVTCTYQGICGVNNGGCNHLAQCRDNPRIGSTYVECICPHGFVGSGIGPSGCVRSSDAENDCLNNPCVHGTCTINNVTGAYICRCTQKFTGRNCDIRKNPCQPNPCENGGTCSSIADLSFRCVCAPGYTGDTCNRERQACGGHLRGLTGTLKYPTSSSTVSGGGQIGCGWIIQTNSTKVLNVTFTEFHLEDSSNCRYEWLQIHDGRNSAAHTIGRYCGSQFPNGGTIVSTHNQLYLWFRSDPSVSNPGFTLNWNSIDPVCGGSVTVTSHGTITSPGFPGNYPSNRDCNWHLSAGVGKRLQFHFFSLVVGNNPNCSFDYLSIHEGYSSTDRVLAKYCNTSNPEPLYSSGSEISIHFHSDASNTYSGFQIAYSAIGGIPGCGGIYTANDGEITSPTVDGHYSPDLNCEYKISVLEKSRIKITFLSFDLEDDDNCSYDYLEIREGSTEEAPLINRYCGNRLPPPYITVGNHLFIIFVTDWGNNEAGFHMKYETVCGGTYSESSGVITSPGYPAFYAQDQICIYEIAQPLGTSISLTFIEFDLESSVYSGCLFDFLEIRDGDNENSTLIGTYCGSPPPTIESSFNYLWMKFESDSSVSMKGFLANYTTTTLGCGGILKQNTGVLQSPRESSSYPAGSTCTWIITAPAGNVVQLSWSLFQLEQSSSCSFDYVEVYNNFTKNERIGRYCGSKLPPTLISSSNVLTVKFVSDSSINFDGFMAAYSFMDESTACGGRYFTSSGVLKSPFYPEEYPSNRECAWIITANPGQQIMLNVTDFSLEPYPSCTYDYLEIRNGGSSSAPLVGKFCGTTIPKQIHSLSNQLYILFKSDMSQSYKGFFITWESTATGCGGLLTSPKGSIISPYYPEPYNEDSECYWRISTSAGSILELLFADLELEAHWECGIDYVEIFDGSTTMSKSLGKFCSSGSVSAIRSTTNHLTVKFVSDGSMQYRGFFLQYSTVCKNTLKGFRGVIESPNFPDTYSMLQDCTWRIEVNLGNKINVSFSHFNLARMTTEMDATNCSKDYLELKYSGEGDEMIKLDTYCDTKLPPLTTINSNVAEVHYATDNFIMGTGFRLEWEIEGCGGVLTRPNGHISTPNFPNGYPEATQCDWVIQLDYGSSIQINFTTIDLETSYNCNYDYIMIVNGPDETYPMLTKICSKSNEPVIVTSTGNAMFVRFESDYSYKGRGFYANYTTVPTKCGGTFTAPQGAITSPNYPKNYDMKDTCEWLISIGDGHIIELTFDDLDLAGNCNKDFIKIYDGPSTAYPVLDTVCGTTAPNTTIRSTFNHIVVEMRTSEEYTAKGFLANYTTACGARIETESSGIISLSDSGLVSTLLTNCSWTIIAKDPSEHVSLTITHVDPMECYGAYNQIQIYGGETSESPLIGRYCDSKIPATITSEGNALHIEIEDPTHNFIAKYYVIDSACGGTLTGAEGYFTTPKYPNSFPVEIECEWTIHVSLGNQVSLSFNSFELVSSENCHLNYLEIRENDGKGKLLGTFCDSIPTNITRVGNLWLFFKSSKSSGDNSGATAQGFLAEYSLIHGTELTGSKGEIQSPLYPYYYIKSATYKWRITVTFGKIISIVFKDFFVESYSDDCYLSTFEVFDGFDEEAPSLKKLCGVSLPDPIKSTSNTVYIVMIYDSVRHGSRFDLEWLEIDITPKVPSRPKGEACGSKEIIDMNNVTLYNLTSPGYPNGYAAFLDCEWIFSTEPEYHLKASYDVVDLENVVDECIMDTIKIYKGQQGSQDWTLLSTVCFPNSSLVTPIHAGSLMKVVFHSDSYTNGSGFSMKIKKACGGSITKPNGIISLKENSTKYHQSCQWNITVNPGRTIKVTFLALNIASRRENQPCSNYLLLKNGHFPDSPILGDGKYCNNSIPSPLITTGSSLYVQYTGFPGFSFELAYDEVSIDCGGTVTLTKYENSSRISSPNYPNIPLPYSECFWTIIGPPGESLRIDFDDRFDLTKSKNCKSAAVEIRDGGSKYSSLLGQFCNQMPNSTFSSGNMLFIRFFTNVADPRNGFKATVSIASCGGITRSSIGEVHSPNFNVKSMYPKNSNCVWHIIGPTGHYLILNFNTIDLPVSSDCSSEDHVTLSERYKYNDTINEIGTYCGSSNPGEIKTGTNEVIVMLVTGSIDHSLAGFSIRFNVSREECGGKLNSEFGIIESPGYPSAISNDRECEWTITVPEGRRITLEFIDLDLNPYGYDNSVSTFNDNNYNSHISRHFNDTKVLKSSSNIMVVWFWAVHSTSHRGFRARFSSDEPTICVGSFNNTNGVLSYINESFYYCVYKHSTGFSSNVTTISMVITLDLAANNTTFSCRDFSASITVTSDNLKDTIARFCETLTRPAIVRSPYPITHLIINKQERFSEIINYSVNYTTNPCGGIIDGEEGYINTPGFPNKYRDTIECAWILKLPKDQRVQVNFTDVDLDPNCELNYIIIYNGDHPSSPKIGHYCHNDKPNVIKAQSNIILIEYHSDARSNGKGFKVHYEPIIGGCSGVFHDDTRIIETPSYPANYPNNTECDWEIMVKNGYHVLLQFVDRFYIEQSENCANDFIEIWDYKEDVFQSLGKKCGRETPAKINSTSNRLKIVFRSNDKVRATGFKANWSIECGGTFEATSKLQYIVSPGYPIEYANSLNCVYNITSSEDYVNVVFEDFALEKASQCFYDNVTVKDVQIPGHFEYVSSRSPHNKLYCGTDAPPPMRARYGVIITFRTDPWFTRRGFKISYQTDTCGGVITEPSEIYSPITAETNNGIRTYAGGMECSWNISAPTNKTIIVKFTAFELEHNSECAYDSVAIYDGFSSNYSSRLAFLCGNLTYNLPVVKSTSNTMSIYLKTDYTNHFAGFKAEVYFTYGPTVGCGGVINVTDTKVIEAPAGLSHLDCHWQIMTDRDHILKVTFNELHLVPCAFNMSSLNVTKLACSCSSIEIRDGGGAFSELMIKKCDNVLPVEYSTSGNSVWIRLFSALASTSKPFKVTITKAPSLCGPTVLNVTNQTQVLTSPSYPNSYPNNIKCSWRLENTDYMDQFDLHFVDFDLVETSGSDLVSKTCGSDRVEIYDKMFSKVVTDGLGTATIFAGTRSQTVYGGMKLPIGVHPYCGKRSLSFDHYTGQNQAVVSFYSGAGAHGRGFKMEYTVAGCSRNFTSVQGRIMNPHVTSACIITITSPENTTLALHFMTFIMHDVGTCEETAMEIHDGDSKNSPQLAKLCGYTTPNSIFSRSNKLWISVRNTNVNSLAFYDATFISTTEGKGCGGVMYNYVGKFTSPFYPSIYREEKTCTWEVTVPQEQKAVLKFTEFDITGSCTANFVIVKTYNDDDSVPTEHRFCKEDVPAVLTSQNNHISVSYTTTVNNGGTGWVANFMAVTEDTDLNWEYN